MAGVIKVKIFRFDPDKDERPYYQEYRVPVDRAVTVRELLTIIYHDQDGTLAFRDYLCYKGSCNTCIVKLNGKNIKSCATQVHPGEEIRLDPIQEDRVVRDLVVDFKGM